MEGPLWAEDTKKVIHFPKICAVRQIVIDGQNVVPRFDPLGLCVASRAHMGYVTAIADHFINPTVVITTGGTGRIEGWTTTSARNCNNSCEQTLRRKGFMNVVWYGE